MKTFTRIGIVTLLLYCLSVFNVASAQNLNAEKPEIATAILDTTIPFAIGAREGEQTIRGAFGWPTFQEGFVEGVYFRFDPDGYARFSTSPRLDEDVFEVICQNGTTLCVARKNILEIGLTEQGKPQIQIVGTTQIDRFFISDRKNELPLPNTILGPMDQKLETLLSSGGDLIIRREQETLQTLSLSGFSATVTYLRWVAQNQASFIFPRGWPVPSQQPRQQNTRYAPSDTWNNARSNPVLTAPWNSNNPQGSNGQSLNLSNQIWPNRVAQIKSQLPFTARTDGDVLSANGFAEQAQGRSLPADINRFEVAPLQQGFIQPRIQSVINPSKNSQTEIKSELIRINQSLINLEVKIENLALRLSHEIRSANINIIPPKGVNSNIYQNINSSVKNARIYSEATDELLSEEDKLRKLVIESLLKQSHENEIINPIASTTPEAGEITVKKTIVERLLEELDKPNATAIENVAPIVENAGEFISLSDYINKVMRDEAKQ